MDRRTLFLAEGLGHAFMALSEQAGALLVLDAVCAEPGAWHRSARPKLGIAWPLRGLPDGPVLSAKDAEAPSLTEALKAGALSEYQICRS